MNNAMNQGMTPGVPRESATDKFRDAATHAREAASSAASAVRQGANDMASGLGNRMESLGGRVRDRAPQEGVLGRAAEGMACALEQGGRYLEGGVGQMGTDLTNFIRRNPIPALLAGVGFGFLLATLTKR